jgi:solute carrier family 25 protein 46
LDTGASVIPILTRYDGFFDCWNTITREEGRWGLYKGLGALVLQYALQLSIIKGSLFTFYHMGDLFKPNPGIQPVSPRNQTVLSDRQDRSPKASPELPRGYPLHQQFN